ncbi:MAG: 50S ribosomal protein L4, partial [Candidatus Methanomethylicota archaeon]
MSTEQQVPVFSLDGGQLSLIRLPKVFQTAVRTDLIKRAVISALTARIQPKGRDPLAGKRTTAE